MIVLKGGYYIDEVNKSFEALLELNFLEDFYKENSTFSLENSVELIRQDNIPPLLKLGCAKA